MLRPNCFKIPMFPKDLKSTFRGFVSDGPGLNCSIFHVNRRSENFTGCLAAILAGKGFSSGNDRLQTNDSESIGPVGICLGKRIQGDRVTYYVCWTKNQQGLAGAAHGLWA